MMRRARIEHRTPRPEVPGPLLPVPAKPTALVVIEGSWERTAPATRPLALIGDASRTPDAFAPGGRFDIPEIDQSALALDVALDLLETRIAELEDKFPVSVAEATPPTDTTPSQRPASTFEAAVDAVYGKSVSVTEEMLAKAIWPSIFSPDAASTQAAKKAGGVERARRDALDTARNVLADIRIQTCTTDERDGYTLQEHLTADARLMDDLDGPLATRMRIAAKTISRQAVDLEQAEAEADRLHRLRLNMVPTQDDRIGVPARPFRGLRSLFGRTAVAAG